MSFIHKISLTSFTMTFKAQESSYTNKWRGGCKMRFSCDYENGRKTSPDMQEKYSQSDVEM